MSIGALTSASVNYSDNAPTVNTPAGAVSGDFYVMAIIAGSAVTWPSGFTEIPEVAQDANVGVSMRVAIRAHTGAEGSSFAATTASYGHWAAVCFVVNGVTSLEDSDNTGVSSSYYAAGNPVSLPGGSVSLAGTGRSIAWIGGTSSTSVAATPTHTTPSGFTSAGGVSNGLGITIQVAGYTEGGSGAKSYTGSTSFNADDSHGSLVATLAFVPTGGGGGGGGARLLLLGVG